MLVQVHELHAVGALFEFELVLLQEEGAPLLCSDAQVACTAVQCILARADELLEAAAAAEDVVGAVAVDGGDFGPVHAAEFRCKVDHGPSNYNRHLSRQFKS